MSPRTLQAAMALLATALLAACAKAPPAEVLAPNAGASCLSPVAQWEADPTVRDVTLIRLSSRRVAFRACVASDRPEPLATLRLDIRLVPRDQRPACGTPTAPAWCRVGASATNVTATRTPVPMMPRGIVVLTGESDLPDGFGPMIAPETIAELTWSPCAGPACQPGAPTTTLQSVRATVQEP